MAVKITTINIPDQYLDCVAVLVDMGYYPSRSECVREAIKQFLINEVDLIEDLDQDNFLKLKENQMKVMLGGIQN